MQNREELQDLLELLEQKEKQYEYNKFSLYFPDKGMYSRDKYSKHVEFMSAGHDFLERAFMAANRTGKTLTGAYEMTCHLTGLYPHWWKGRVFKNAVEAWAAGVSNQTTKEVMQEALLGDVLDIGSGMIPKELIVRVTKKSGVVDAVETVYVKHTSGNLSKCTFKAYEQKRISFQGTKKQVIWLDEEPRDFGIYSECLTRLMDEHNPGILYCTFTPLFGRSEVVNSFLPHFDFPKGGVDPKNPYKYVINVDWESVPHLSDDQKAKILASYSKHERDARSKGIPSLGAGAIYPYLEEDITCTPFEIPPWWPKGYGLDPGWNRTAAVFGAMDPDSGVFYLYSEHYRSEAHPAIHASAIKPRGEYLVGAADPAGANQSDGKRMFDLYLAEGLNLVKADKQSKEGSILKVSQLFDSGRLKIFNTLGHLLLELKNYSRDEKGKIVKKNDHAIDAMHYLCTTGMEYLSTEPDGDDNYMPHWSRDEYTGY